MWLDLSDAEHLVGLMSDNSYNLDNYVDGRKRRIHSITTLQFESVRLATFYYFKNEIQIIDILEFAKNGYYYDRFYDCILCNFCSYKPIKDENFQPASAPESFPDCPMNKFPLNGNVPQVDSGAEDPLSKINNWLQEVLMFKLQHASPIGKKEIIFKEKFRFRGDGNFSEYGSRLATFTYWFLYLPSDLRPNKERYAEAGFVFTGTSDIVMCFHCKGGLFNLHASDDPVKDHASLYGHCAFIKDYCSRRNIVIEFIPQTIGEHMFSEHGQKLLMEHPMMKEVISKSVDKSIAKKAMVNFVQSRGCFPFNIIACNFEIEKFAKQC